MRMVFLAVTACGLIAVSEASEAYITAKDTETADEAERAVTKYCTADLAGDDVADPEEAKQNLVDALGGENPILDAMMDSEDNDEFGQKLGDNISSALMSSVLPFLLAGVCWTLLGCYCCTAIPCYKKLPCCRPCKVKQQHGVVCKVLAVVPVAFAFLMTIVGSATASGGSSTMIDGFNNMACESATLLDTTLVGQEGDYAFIGLLPALEIMRDVEGILEDNSQFMLSLDATLADTKIVSEAVEIATSALDTMSGVLSSTATSVQSTTQTGYTSTYRKCEYCTTLGDLLTSASSGLSSGIGQALANARNEVNDQLTPTKRAELRNTIRQSAQPMLELKKSFINSIGAFVQPDSDPLAPVKELLPLAVSLVFMGAFFVTFCGFCSTGWCVVRERTSSGKPSKGPHRIACCAWSLSFIFAIFCFILGGILSGVSIPLASICLIMDDVDGQMVRDIAPALELNITGESGESIIGLLDNCINPANKSLNANFLDLITIKNETDGTNETMRALMQTTVSAPINAVFEGITATSSGGATLADSQAIVDLLAAIQANPIEKVIIVDGTQMGDDSQYQALSTSANNDIKGALTATTMACADHTLSGNTLPGMSKFIDAFNNAFSSTSDAGATYCPAGSNADLMLRNCGGDAVCTAGNHFKTLFKHMIDANTWRCDVWQDEAGNECDVYDMSTTTGSLCIHTDGTMSKYEKTCTFDEFKTYYAKNHQRIQKVFQYVDYAVAQKTSAITTNLKDLVYEFMIDPLFSMFDGLSCGFLPGFWQATVDSLCYQGVYGLRRIGQGYTLSAFFIMILGISMYILWRRTIDNVNASNTPIVPVEGQAW